MKPKVTVIVTVKNAVSTIKACIDSIIANKIPNEIIVVDAFSTDGTYDILKRFGKKIKLVRLEGSAPVGFNYGIQHAKAPLIALTDADCVVESDWLKNLVGGIKKNYVASAGSCWTPDGERGLAKAIGDAFDERYDIDKTEVLRAPTMNIAFKTSIAKNVLFSELMPIAFETDFCFRLLKYGKMAYVKDARVYHHHRTSWKKFFKQQKDYGKYGILVYLKHPSKTSGDHISKKRFFTQVILFYLSVVLGISSLFVPLTGPLSLLSLGGIFLLFAYENIKLRPKNALIFTTMLFVRLLAWCVGGLEGFWLFLNQSSKW